MPCTHSVRLAGALLMVVESMLVKDNQRQLLDDVVATFHGPCSWVLDMSSDIDVNLGHGRIEKRSLRVSDDTVGYID